MDRHRFRILSWMGSGTPFTIVEERINALKQFSEEQRSALWLYAWSLQPRRRQLAEANAVISAVAD